ncbi:MAG: SDR family oxidoreductase [Anaerolineales bacterium]|nr:SDR family oxidoreductase [Anaerolineales bacterium]
MSLEDRLAVISGATGGLGSLVARQLAERGMRLALLDIHTERLETLGNDLGLDESRLLTRAVDLLDQAAVDAATEAITTRFKRVDVLLHLVGGWTGGKAIAETPTEDLAFMLNQHVWTSFHLTRAFVPHLVRNGWGRIVMITSPFAARPNAEGGPYAIGKAGQEALMLTLSQELKGSGVTANLLQAKSIDTRRTKVTAPSPDNAAWTTPEELVAGMLYLLSDEAGTINGARLPLYGGY